MADEQVVRQLIDRLRTEEAAAQESTAEEIKWDSVHFVHIMLLNNSLQQHEDA